MVAQIREGLMEGNLQKLWDEPRVVIIKDGSEYKLQKTWNVVSKVQVETHKDKLNALLDAIQKKVNGRVDGNVSVTSTDRVPSVDSDIITVTVILNAIGPQKNDLLNSPSYISTHGRILRKRLKTSMERAMSVSLE